MNLQPAVACYVRRPGDRIYRGLGVDVLAIREGLIAEVTTFDASILESLELPKTLERRAKIPVQVSF